MKNYNNSIGLIALSNIKGIGPAFIKKYKDNIQFENGNLQESICNVLDITNKDYNKDDIEYNIENAKELYEQSIEENIHVISLFSPNYPIALQQLKDAPPILFCKGNLNIINNLAVCVIGTREPNITGGKIASRIGEYFSNRNYSICNGLAEGIDSYSIQNENHFFNNTTGILAGGLNYNSKNTLLKKTAKKAEKVLENSGLLISEMALNRKEDTISVVKSCRLQAGFSSSLILVQSSLTGGSKFTMKAFAELPRPIAIVNPIDQDIQLESYQANNVIINEGTKGLMEMTGLKIDKVKTSDIIILKSKSDYQILENKMNNSLSQNIDNLNTLF